MGSSNNYTLTPKTVALTPPITPAGGNDSVGVEAAVGPHRELAAGSAVAHPPHRLPQEMGGSEGRLARPGEPPRSR